ncbi:hypothetical protein [Paludibacterium purpuratum]|uniref:Condensation domain-containing protein n=1 Tax=Paludibacterium purpuratum TaxID=1144873 RepID=A0A4R7B527_9NEIS|nr:hypothetical protein [Paludibacterium purpuratum]TDR79760.1 hypothetical protein DFP86_107124 [Paludibacterium purpuratum]
MTSQTATLPVRATVAGARQLDALSELFVHLGELTNVNTNQILVVEGCLDASLLERSAHLAMAGIPLLRAQPRPGGAELRTDVFVKPHRLVTHSELDGACDLGDATLRRLLMDFSFHNRLDWRERPPIQLLLVTAADGGSSCVYLSTHHGVADARSDSLLFRRIIDHYAHLSGATAMPPAMKPLPFETLPEIRPDWYRPLTRTMRWLRGFCSVAADLVLRDVGLRVPLTGSRWEGRAAQPDIGELDFFHSVIPEALSARLARSARANGVTLNTLLCAALARQLEHQSAQKRGMLRITCAVSLRRLIDDHYDQSFRNYLVPSKIRIRQGLKANALVRAVHRAIGTARADRQVSDELGRLESLVLALRIRSLHGLARKLLNHCQGTNACYSNPGRIEEDFSSFGSARHPTRQFIGFGCLVPPYDFILYTPTVNGQMQLDVVYRRAAFGDIGQQFAMPLLDRLRQLLDELEPTL